jgi:hypothetical protein
MDEDEAIILETDPRFPSGEWTGFFLQLAVRGRQKTSLNLTCSEGRLTGEGKDWAGRYTIDGSYDLATGQCEWTKQYIGRHAVTYKGTNNGRSIWGVWELTQLWGLLTDRGGFHIWPEGFDVADESGEAERALLEVMRRQPDSCERRSIVAAAIGVAVMFYLTRWRGLAAVRLTQDYKPPGQLRA